MYEMDIQRAEAIDVHRSSRVGKLIDLCFVLPPVIAILLVLRQALDIGQWAS